MTGLPPVRAWVASLCVLAVLQGQSTDVHAASLSVLASDPAGKPVEGAVVFLEATGDQAAPALPQSKLVMDQIDKRFVPRVLVVPVGALVSFPNSDNIRHHVYSFSDALRFELPLYAGTPAAPVRFPQAGVVTLGCNIHDWMRGYIVVVPTALFALTGADGIARIEAVPAGPWRVMGWHPDVADQSPAMGPELTSADAAMTAAVTLELKRKLQIRRAPAARAADRY